MIKNAVVIELPQEDLPDEEEMELQIAVSADKANERVFIGFGFPIDSLDMSPDHADLFADAIKMVAEEARAKAKTNLFIM